MALDNEALKVIRLEAQMKRLQEDCATKEFDLRQTQKAIEDFKMRMQDWEQQDQDLKEHEIALKERELSLYQREVLLWESKADLARRERQDADALYERWKRTRDYHITAIESEKRMRAEIKDERKRLEEYEKEVVRREKKNAKKLEEFNDLHSLEAHRIIAAATG